VVLSLAAPVSANTADTRAAGASGAEEYPVVRVAVLKYGTANWELELIRQLGLDRKHGFRLELLQRVSPNASLVALQGGAADFTVSDWLWVAQQHAAERAYHFFPYSSAVGELLVPPDSSIGGLKDLAGAELGVAGGAEDKSWLLFQAYARGQGLELKELATPRYAAPPLLNCLAGTGQLDAVLTYWHYAARLKAVGFRPVLSLEQVLVRLGVESSLPMLGWVFSSEFANKAPDRVDSFLAASYEAKRLLEADDEAWERVRPLMQADSESVFQELRAGYRAGVPDDFGEDEIEAIERVAAIVAAARASGEQADAERRLPASVFWMRAIDRRDP
jgi:NitT/TauT family transport system substrate-binding protein